MIARTEIPLAANRTSTEIFAAQGIAEVQLGDGLDCGLAAHDDPDKANRAVVPRAMFEQYPLAHPNCVRRGWPKL